MLENPFASWKSGGQEVSGCWKDFTKFLEEADIVKAFLLGAGMLPVN